MEELKTFQSPDPNSAQRMEMQLRFDLLFRELLRASDDLFTMIGEYPGSFSINDRPSLSFVHYQYYLFFP